MTADHLWKRFKTALIGFLLFTAGSWSYLYGAVTLESLIDTYSKNSNAVVATTELAPEWIGTVTRTYPPSGTANNPEVEPRNIRLSHGWIRDGSLAIARMRKDLKEESETCVYRKTLPPVAAILKCKSVAELNDLLGYEYGDGLNRWGNAWTVFTVAESGRIRYLSVGAFFPPTSSPIPASAVTPISISEGTLIRAEANSAEQLAKFKTGQQLYEESEAAKEQSRAKYPRPLQDLLSAGDQTEEKEHLYVAYVNTFRAHPDLKLIQQLLAQMDEDTMLLESHLENILIDDRSEDPMMKLKPWEALQRRQALDMVIDSLALTKNANALQAAVTLVLRAIGGGELKIKGAGEDEQIAIKVELTKDGDSMHTDQFDHTPFLVKEAQAKLRVLVDRHFKKEKK